MPEKHVQVDLFIKASFKKTDFWENGVIFINDRMANPRTEIFSLEEKLNKLMPIEKMEVALFVVRDIAEQAKINTSEFIGNKIFRARMLREVFKDKKIKIDKDDLEKKELKDVSLAEKDWYAQTGFYGTEEEQNFISFIDGFIERLRQKYSDIALLRNEKFFQVFDFDEGRAFEPDFVMILKKRNKVISIYQIFIEPKGDQFKDANGGFKNSKEGWKQQFLLRLEREVQIENRLEFENKHFKIIGLPFYNEKLKKEFEQELRDRLLR